MQWSLYDELIRRATQDEAVVIAARQSWEVRTGAVSPEHDLYHERSEAFVEWFLIERRDGAGLTTVEQQLIRSETEAGPPGFRELLLALQASQRSLFRVVRLRPGGLLLDDLLRGTRFVVDERRSLPGVLAGDLFEARLIPDPDTPYRLILGRAVLFHPREAAAVLLQLAQEVRRRAPLESPSAFLEQLLRLRLKALTYRHVSPARIYSAAHGA